MLEMRDHCEKCDASTGFEEAAYICSYECTFCEPCATEMSRVCPNCAGQLVKRPKRSIDSQNS